MRLIRAVRSISFLLTLSLISLGCAGSADLGTPNAGDLFHHRSAPQEISVQHPPSLVIGSRFIYREINASNGKVCKVAMIVKEMKEFETKPAYWVEVRRETERYFDIYDMNLNWIGSFAEGKELESAEPCIRVFDWPLTVGKRWKSDYTVNDYSGGSHFYRSKTAVNIQTDEEVLVPAGIFRALRIQAGEETLWYAPTIGWAVREQIMPRDGDGWFLELVEYNIPPKIHPEKS
ncbi:MAG TPA: hypothetical protein VEK32_14940 [Thermodesulfobacteriota bacterium]|nr:hypothetical protein [Thermodesulfobacteriota bacterium]